MTARPAKPKLVPEYRIVLTLSGGVITTHSHPSLREAEDAALRLVRADVSCTWVIERRMTSEWAAMPTPTPCLC